MALRKELPNRSQDHEPTTALDICVRAQIVGLARELQARIGLSALFITCDLNSVRSRAHNVAVMRLGKIVEHGRD